MTDGSDNTYNAVTPISDTEISISVVIPTYNRAETVLRALESVSSQTRQPFEVIVVDNGSTDSTPERIRSQFPGVRYYYLKALGVSRARNLGIDVAQGNWLAFLDSDDEWHPHKLEQQIRALTLHPEFRICHTDEIWIRNGKRVNAMDKHAKSGGYIFSKCLPLCVISPSSVLIHREVFADIGNFDESLPACEDYDLWLRICGRYPVLFLPEKLILKYGGHADQLSRKYWGMDRFRITALEGIVWSGALSDDNLHAALSMLLEKIEIYITGAKKRKKFSEVAEYEKKKESYITQRDHACRL